MPVIRNKILIIAILATGLFGRVPTTSAQFGGSAGFADAFRIEFLERDLPLFVETLQLEDWQRPIVEALLQDYQVKFTVGVESVRDQMKTMTERLATTREDQVMKMILEPLDQWNDRRAQYRLDFLMNVKAQLSPDQIARWPHFERTLRREKSLPKGELMGESIDLFLVSRKMRMPYEVQESLEPVLMEYEVSLDISLANRDQRIESLQDDIKDAMSEMDFEKGLKAMDQIMASRVRVRQVQDEYIIRIADTLPADWSETFETTAMKEAYPKVYRPTPIEALLKSVRQDPTLTEDQKRQLDAIEVDFDEQRGVLENRLLQAYRINEPQAPRVKVQTMLDRRDGKKKGIREPTEMDTIAAQRNDLVFETRKRILAVLSPEQIGDIPGTPKDKPDRNAPRTRTPLGPVPPGSTATPTGSNKVPPKFGGAPGAGGKSKPERINPSDRSGGKGKSRGGGSDN